MEVIKWLKELVAETDSVENLEEPLAPTDAAGVPFNRLLTTGNPRD